MGVSTTGFDPQLDHYDHYCEEQESKRRHYKSPIKHDLMKIRIQSPYQGVQQQKQKPKQQPAADGYQGATAIGFTPVLDGLIL